MKIYGDRNSGNCYKIQLTCGLLGLDHTWIDLDIMANECQTDEFKALNPNAKIPLLQLNDGRCLSESNAIINYLAKDSALLPNDDFDKAKMQQWQFFEQYSHEPYIAVARFINKYLGLPKDRIAEYKAKQVGGHKALRVMEAQLTQSKYLVSDSMTCADISLFAYTHVAAEGGFDLTAYPKIQGWIEAIKAHPLYQSMG